ncbi:hypothetical protein [Paenibacillus sp. Soil787]|uniref:hypothetical protein n=1 Tax=Paenibacillus sp. Soil787 TaxID=1736411 RepID=UPI0007027F52|nr:hypothetical protein [Paenibacillus sp. Soil787]KRF13683.1 hypothetical protein ASG93_14340 [Paenibacillus sp. Soil787]
MENNELIAKLKSVCKELILQLRGNKGENRNALIDRKLISDLHLYIDLYKHSIRDDNMVSKEIVGILLYTCSRFYIQSKYSKNSDDLLKEFDRLNGKLLGIFVLKDM